MWRILLIALVLLGIFAFAAEPTTSTEADMHDGRAHGAYLHAGSVGARFAHAADPSENRRVPVTVAVLATLLALLVTAPTVPVVSRVGRDGTAVRWATTARRGPPARAF